MNRGVGWVTFYLAAGCNPIDPVPTEGDQVQTMEQHDLKIVSLDELREATRNGEIIEVQWSNTVAMASLHPEMASLN